MTAPADGDGKGRPPLQSPPPGLWSLWDLYNFRLIEFHTAIRLVAETYEQLRRLKAEAHDGRDFGLTEGIRSQVRTLLVEVQNTSERAGLIYSLDHLNWILGRIDNQEVMTGDKMIADMSKLHETLISDARGALFYRYPSGKAEIVQRIDADWEAALTRFEDARAEIRAGVDLYALDHATAAIFHFMRAVEVALRALARHLKVTIKKGKPIDVSQWQEILDAIDDKTAAVAQTNPSAAKQRAFEFWSEAARHMTGFKDKYRNAVSHSTAKYDDHEALSCMLQVRDFMNGLGARLPAGKGKITF